MIMFVVSVFENLKKSYHTFGSFPGCTVIITTGEPEESLFRHFILYVDEVNCSANPNYSYILSQPFCGSHISPLFRKREGIKGVSLWRGWEDLISYFPFPKLTLSFSLSCPAIEGDDHTLPLQNGYFMN